MSAAIEILTPEKNATLERAIGVTEAARFVIRPSATSEESTLITSISD